MEFASWYYDQRYLDYFPDKDSVELQYFIPSSEFEIISFKTQRSEYVEKF